MANIGQAEVLLSKYVDSESLLRHSKTVSVILGYFAAKNNLDRDYWECVGLLHDIDFQKYPEEHLKNTRKILESERANFPFIDEQMIRAILSHGWGICSDVKPESFMEKILYTVDELSGLIFACAMAHPSKKVADVKTSSVNKKFKSLAFAKNCSRDVIKSGCDMLGIPLETMIADTLEAMKENAEAIGL